MCGVRSRSVRSLAGSLPPPRLVGVMSQGLFPSSCRSSDEASRPRGLRVPPQALVFPCAPNASLQYPSFDTPVTKGPLDGGRGVLTPHSVAVSRGSQVIGQKCLWEGGTLTGGELTTGRGGGPGRGAGCEVGGGRGRPKGLIARQCGAWREQGTRKKYRCGVLAL